MKYSGFYFALFRGKMKRVLSEHFGKKFASDKHIPPERIQEMMCRSLYYVKFYFSIMDLTRQKGSWSTKRAF